MRRVLIPVAWGFVGVLVGYALIHLWTDHLALHEMLNFLVQHRDKIAGVPVP